MIMKMKLLFIALSISVYCHATIRTVNNNNPSPGQFTTFAAAHTAAVAGDTLYISGSPTSYGTTNITKQLIVIGTGHNPDKQNPLVSTFVAINCNTGSGSKFVGLTFTGNVTNAQNATYEYCKFNAIFIFSAAPVTATFNKCVFTTQAIVNNIGSNTAIFNNCILTNSIGGGTSTLTGGFASNCLFLGNAITSVGNNFSGFNFINNIFYGTSPQVTGTNISTGMTNNLSFNCPNNNFNGTIQNGSLINVDPLFISYSLPGFHYTDNYLLQAISPGHHYGNDGKDIGLYGGLTGFIFHMGGEPAIPQVRQMNTDTAVPVGQTMNVNVISNSQQ
jgi:hypothetical protein